MANVHTPQRTEGESFSAYKARRAQSNKAAAAVVRGQRIAKHLIPATSEKTQRREEVRAIGLRQMRRERYLAIHTGTPAVLGYGFKHPAIAARYEF